MMAFSPPKIIISTISQLMLHFTLLFIQIILINKNLLNTSLIIIII